MKRLFSTFAAAAIALSAFGWGSAPTSFLQIQGVQEFSGRMIARPLQMTPMLRDNVPYHAALAIQASARGQVQPLTIRYYDDTDEYIIRVPKGSNENLLASKLMASGAFQYVEPDWTVYPVDTTPNDPQFGTQWHLPKIKAPAAWDLFRGTNTVTVAITDTGVRLDHEDLQPLLVSGANSASGTAIPQSSGGQVADIHGHGTHCCGTAAAAGNNAKGVSGVGWNFRIMPIRVTNSSGGSASITALTVGARWAADNGARVISTSYSGASSATVQTTGNYIKNTRNGVYCWAAGNSNSNLSTFDHLDVTIVGATDSNDAKASFSSYCRALDVFAPGVNIYSTLYSGPAPGTAYGFMSGTSMATPCTAGVAAMIIGTNPLLNAQEAETVLYTSCLDLTAPPGGPGNDDYWGWGRVDVNAGVRQSYNNFPFAPPTITVVSGNPVGGAPVDVSRSDNQYASYSGTLFQPVVLEAQANTSLLQLGQLSFVLEGKVTAASITQTIQLFDWVANGWVQVDFRAAAMSDQVVTVTPTNSGRFIQAGTGLMKARLTYAAVRRTTGFQADIDQIGWFTRP